jgi:hypothetical protein
MAGMSPGFYFDRIFESRFCWKAPGVKVEVQIEVAGIVAISESEAFGEGHCPGVSTTTSQ